MLHLRRSFSMLLKVGQQKRINLMIQLDDHNMGENKSLSFAREYVFWPSMAAQIKDKVRSCPICNAFRNQQPRETLHPHEVPALPWQVVSTDIFEYGGHSYLLVTDFYSKYFEIELLRQTTANCLINNLKKIFARFGIPAEVLIDNGSQYSNTRNIFNLSSRGLQTSGDSVTPQALQSIRNLMELSRKRCKRQNGF